MPELHREHGEHRRVREPPEGLVRPSGPESAAFVTSEDTLVHDGELNGDYNDYRPSWPYFKCGRHAGSCRMQLDGMVTCFWCIVRAPRVDWMTQE